MSSILPCLSSFLKNWGKRHWELIFRFLVLLPILIACPQDLRRTLLFYSFLVDLARLTWGLFRLLLNLFESAINWLSSFLWQEVPISPPSAMKRKS